jgi:predicted Zn-dependent protease
MALVIAGAFKLTELFESSMVGSPWKKDTITFYNDTSYKASLYAATNQWEKTGIADFNEVFDKNQADIVFLEGDHQLKKVCNNPDDCIGHADLIGYRTGTTNHVYLQSSRDPDSEYQQIFYTPVIVHEIGHVLGLTHDSRDCSVMNSERWTDTESCALRGGIEVDANGTNYQCGPFIDDLERMENIYRRELEDPGPCNDPAATNKTMQGVKNSLISDAIMINAEEAE